MVADALPVLHVLAAAAQNFIGPIPQLLGNDGRDDLPGLVLEHDPFLRREELLLLGEHIHHLDLVAHIVALVFGVGDHAGQGGMGDLFAVVVAVSFFPEQGLQLFHGIGVGGVALKELPHHGGLPLVDDQPPIVFDVAEDAAVAQYDVLLDGLLVAEFDTGAKLPQLVLCDAGHDGQPQFRILIEGVDVVVLEKHADAMA